MRRTLDVKMPECEGPLRGVFWVIDGELLFYPFRPDAHDGPGVAKSGNTFNHKALWNSLSISSKPYNYYPRGRVDVSNKGNAVIYLNPVINTETLIEKIKHDFGIRDDAFLVRQDYSDHYKCYLDDGWKPA